MLLLLTTVTDAQGIDLNVIRKVRRISCGFDILRKKTGKTCGSNAIESSFNTFQFRKKFRERVTNARLNRSREFREISSYSREVLLNIVSHSRSVDLTKTQRERFLPFLH